MRAGFAAAGDRADRQQRRTAQYDLRETPLRRAFDRARRTGGKTGEVLIEILETRLDAVVLRSGLTGRPLRREVPVICDEQLVVEHYSR